MIGSSLQERYELSAELGRGGMGVVFEAWDPRLNREVAVKVILPENLNDEIEQRFRREARVVARLDHPGIVPIFDYGRHEGSLFFVMPRLRGDTLRDLLAGRSLDVDEILRIAVEIAEALDYSSTQGVVHRDIKPGNIMVSREDEQLRVRVMDFGLARPSMEPSMSGSATLIGTPFYLSPEQVIGEKVDGRSDIYSLGALLYECLSGEPPFPGDMYSVIYRIVNEQPQGLRSRGVDVDEQLDGIVLSCLAKDPSARPQRGRDLAEALSGHLAGLRESVSASVLMARPPRAAASAVLPLVGREAELAELRHRLEAALTHECQWVLVGGEAGIGKTRLLQEFENQARVSQVRVLRSRFADRESALPYQGFCELIQDYFRAHKGLRSIKVLRSIDEAGRSADKSAEKTGRRADISELATDLIALFPVLAEIRELREAQRLRKGRRSGKGQGPREGQPTFLFEVLARTLAWMADGRPMVLLLENLHEAEASLEALKYVFYRLGPSPILIVGTYRDTDLARNDPLSQWLRGLNDDPRAQSLVLKRLDAEAFLDLVTFLVGGAPLDQQFIDELFETAEGNPFFGIELVRSYLETGNLQCGEDGVFRLSEAAATQVLPKTIRETVEGRIERLETELQRVLSIASVLGRSFEYRELEQVMDDGPSDLDEALDLLVAQGILEEGRRTRGDWLVFSSAVVREALYRNLSQRRRNALHRSHALALEKRHAGRLERIYPRLVHHFSMGGMAEKTVEYAAALARQSLAAWSSTDAIQAISTALEMVDEVAVLVGRGPASAREGELRELLARAHRVAGNTEAALAEAARAVDVYDQAKLPEKKVRMVQLAAQTAWQLRRMDDVESWVSRGLGLARRTGSLDVLERLLTLGATVANLRGAYTVARRYLEEAEKLSLASGIYSVVSNLAVASEELVPSGGTLVVALRQPIVNLAPGALKTFEEQEISANVYETLVSFDQEGNLVPALCQDWQGSAEMNSFEFTLRPGVRFADGVRLSAREVKASLERSARRKYYSPPMALTVLVGLKEFIDGQANHIAGIEVLEGERQERLRFQLIESLPIFPATLTDQKIAISRLVSESEVEIGTGPFRIVRREGSLEGPGRVVLESQSDYWRGVSANLDRIEFLTSWETSEITAGLRLGKVDLAWDLVPDDLEDFLRDPHYQAGWSEVTTNNVYFAMFNLSGPIFRQGAARGDGAAVLRRVLLESVRIHDLVWRSLGRLAQPALSLIPPGVFGHNPGRRRYPLSLERARELLHGAGWSEPIILRTVVHPFFHDRFEPFLTALRELLSRLGVELQIETRTLKQYISRWANNEDIDLFIGRWNGDYDDPDSYTYALLHSRNGLLRRYYHSEDTDLLMDLARQERQAANRQTLYWNLEAVLDEKHAVLPLFHDVEYRIAGPRVRGFRLSHVLPYVNYLDIGKAEEVDPAMVRRPNWQQGSGEIHVPIPSRVDTLDPLAAGYADHLEVTSNVFETLTRIVEGARVVAWLASSFETLAGGRSYRFQLRPDVRFHDGRRLTARDVRYTYERVLQTPGHNMAHLLLPIRGARNLRDGQVSGLAGLRIVSAEEIVIDLENSLELFPAFLAQAGLAIVQEGQEPVGMSWRDGVVGTGPFRVVRFVPGERVEMERNPHFRRPDIPRSERLVFHLEVASDEAVEGLRRGRFSLASRLRMSDVEALRQDPEWAQGSFEVPGLSTWFLALNSRRGSLADPVLRRALVRILDVEDCVEQALGRQGFVAKGLIPPGLLGSLAPREGAVSEDDVDSRSSDASRGILAGHQDWRLRAAVHVAFSAQYAAFWEQLRHRFHALGITLDVTWGEKPETTERALGDDVGSFDLAIDHWYAYYPDVDSFAMGLLHSQEGHHGGFVASPEIDQLSEEGRWQADPAARHELYRQIESILARDALLVPLFYEQTYHFRHPRVKGFRSGFSFPMVSYERLTAMP